MLMAIRSGGFESVYSYRFGLFFQPLIGLRPHWQAERAIKKGLRGSLAGLISAIDGFSVDGCGTGFSYMADLSPGTPDTPAGTWIDEPLKS